MSGLRWWERLLVAFAFALGVIVVATQLTLMIMWELGYWDGPYR